MGKGKIIAGIILIILAALFYTFAKENIIIPLILTLIGLALIIFYESEDKIEKQKSKRNKKQHGK